jgi:hypothetical protein
VFRICRFKRRLKRSHGKTNFITKFTYFFSNKFFLFSNRRVCPFYGILEILASNVVVWTTKVETVDGPICSFCDRYVSPIYRTTTNSCVSWKHNYIITLFPPTPRILDIPKTDVPRKNKTLVFLCARLSAGNTLTVGYFDKLVASLEQSERWAVLIAINLVVV